MDKIEMSLDDIIESHKPQRGAGHRGGLNRSGGRSGPRGNATRGKSGYRGHSRGGPMQRGVFKGRGHGGIQRSTHSFRGDVSSAWKHDKYEGSRKNMLAVAGRLGSFGELNDGGKLMVANLDSGVSESDVTALFEDIGPLKSVALHYDRSARSLGTADVVFEHRSDAIKAMKQYNGVPLDGRRMSIQLTTSEVPVPARPPYVPPRSFRGQAGGPRGGRGAPRGENQAPRGGRGGGPRRQQRESKTAEELDAELDAYINEAK
ncbi:THO complex subunit 4-like [Aedes albopictus]|uniref:RRM domain-containing protein n=1 Tax=Aedes albopictus TaxID=7160 RepID=A0ABM1ZC26_AEDAL